MESSCPDGAQVLPAPCNDGLLLDSEQPLGALVPSPWGCDTASSEALPSEGRMLQTPLWPGPLASHDATASLHCFPAGVSGRMCRSPQSSPHVNTPGLRWGPTGDLALPPHPPPPAQHTPLSRGPTQLPEDTLTAGHRLSQSTLLPEQLRGPNDWHGAFWRSVL